MTLFPYTQSKLLLVRDTFHYTLGEILKKNYVLFALVLIKKTWAPEIIHRICKCEYTFTKESFQKVTIATFTREKESNIPRALLSRNHLRQNTHTKLYCTSIAIDTCKCTSCASEKVQVDIPVCARRL